MAHAIFRDNESQLISEFFQNRAPGFFVDVGAADPQLGSQSWCLEQAGWSGVLVEPRPDCAERLRRERQARVYEVACSSPRNAGRTMQLRLRGGFSTLNDSLVVAGMTAPTAIPVLIRTLDDILTEAGAPDPIDFLSIDVEGHEIEVLEGFDFNRWKPRLILIEDHVLDRRLHHWLQKRHYKWVRRSGLNGWYVPVDCSMSVSWIGRLQFVRKYYLAMPARRVRDAVRHVRALTGIMPPTR